MVENPLVVSERIAVGTLVAFVILEDDRSAAVTFSALVIWVAACGIPLAFTLAVFADD
jgi:hypothetical protein